MRQEKYLNISMYFLRTPKRMRADLCLIICRLNDLIYDVFIDGLYNSYHDKPIIVYPAATYTSIDFVRCLEAVYY